MAESANIPPVKSSAPWRRWAAEGAILLAILALGAALRLTRLGGNPPGVFRDEAEKAMNAWAIARRGEAFEFYPGPGGYPLVQWRRWPLFIDVLGAKVPAIYQWALAPFCRGGHPPSPAVLRLPAALAGVLTIGALYGAARPLFGAWVALAAAFWLAVSPWHIAFTRWALEGAFVPLFMTIGMGGLALGLRRRAWNLVAGGVGLGLAFYAYTGARPFVLSFIVVAVVLRWKAWIAPERRKAAVATAVVFALVAAPAVVSMLMSGGSARMGRISVFGGERSFGMGIGAFFVSYLKHYSLGFLLLHGDPLPRHGVGVGVLNLVEFLFALIGLWKLARSREPERPLWIAWLALFPLGAALTNPAEMPHALRSLVALPLPQLLAGQGVAWLASFCRPAWPRRAGSPRSDAGESEFVVTASAVSPSDASEKRLKASLRTKEPRPSWKAKAQAHAALVWTFVGAATAASVAGFAFNLFALYPRYSGLYWEAGFGEALKAARAQAAPGAPVVISGDIAMAPYLTLYYDGVSPDRLAAEGWGALRADFPPPAPNFDLRPLWATLPKGATLLALPQEILNAFPFKIVHPPARTEAESEELPETYAVYRKN